MFKIKTLTWAAVIASAAIGLNAMAENPYGLPDNIQDGNILHCFDWSTAQIIEELPAIAEAGFTAVQVSPMQGNAAANAEWFYAYLPYDLAIRSTGVGTRSLLKHLCEEADKYGIKIIVDVVANHINGSADHRAPKWNNTEYWHSTSIKSINYSNRTSVTHDNLGQYPDLNSEHADVQAAAAAFVADLASIGVKGIRWDAAKHIGLPSESCDFWPAVTQAATGLYHYGEILDGPGGASSTKYTLLKEYTQYMSITDTEYSDWVYREVTAGRVPSGHGSWTANDINSSKIVYWGESHDTYSNDGGKTKNAPQDRIDRVWAIGACRAGESSLYFSRPAETERTKIKMGVKGSTHFTAPEIAAVNHLRNAMVGTADFYTGSNGVACVTRAGGGACIVVADGNSREVSVSNGGSYMPSGTFTDQVSGNTFTVTPSTITGTVGATGIAVIYDTDAPRKPFVSFNPGSCSFTDETLTVSATLVNATSGWVSVDGGEHIALNTNGATTFTIGENVATGSTINVDWSATGDGGTSNGTMTYVKEEVPVVELPATFYVLGEIDSNTWAPNKGLQMTAKGTKFTVEATIKGYFSFAKTLADAWASLNADGNRYGASSDATLSIGTPHPLEQINDPKAFSLSGADTSKKYTIQVDWARMEVAVLDNAGIDNAAISDETPAEYFTLQGIRLAGEPTEPGLYIKRQGRNATKIYVR